jgi:RNA polymerase sigma-70 factor, ECF subfamily
MEPTQSVVAFRTGADTAPVSAHADRSAPAGNLPSDNELMQRYQRGDARAFEILYLRHKGALYRYLQRLCRNREAVNDLFQETWGKVISSRDRYQPTAQFGAFLFRIAHNCAVDYFRRAERQHIGRTEDVGEMEEILPGTDIERPDMQLSESQLQTAFAAALNKLPIDQRNVFVLYEETGLTLEEIGDITGVGFETAKSRLRYALSKLRSALHAFDPRNTLHREANKS